MSNKTSGAPARKPISVFLLDDQEIVRRGSGAFSIGDGLTNRQIGERLSVAEKTVKHYVSVLFVKLGMEQRTRAAAYAAGVFDSRTSELSRDLEITDRKPP